MTGFEVFLVFLALFAVLPTGSGTEFAKLMHFSKVLVGIDRSANGQWYRICEIRAFPKNLVGIDRSANGQQCISSEMYYSGLRRRPGSSDLNSADNSDWFSSRLQHGSGPHFGQFSDVSLPTGRIWDRFEDKI